MSTAAAQGATPQGTSTNPLIAKMGFKGVIKLDARDSTPDRGPFTPARAPEGLPNILIVLYDDTGLAAWSPMGGAINMPTLQKLADNGLMYSQWHTTALCSPTRSTFLTGRNHHLNGNSCVTEAAQGFPGWSSRIPDECATVGQVLQEAGWSTVPEGVAISIRGRSYKIVSDVEITDPDASGVIFAHGSRFGGHSLFLKDRKLYYVYNFLGIKPEQKFVSAELKPGKYTLGMEFVREKAGPKGESLGKTTLYVNGQPVAQGDMRTQTGKFTLSGDGLCVGFDSGDAVSEEYKSPGRFKGGTILGVGVDVSPEVYVDLEREASRAMSRD